MVQFKSSCLSKSEMSNHQKDGSLINKELIIRGIGEQEANGFESWRAKLEEVKVFSAKLCFLHQTPNKS